jgi:tubulin polyglutamylase TTLL9
VAVQKTNAKYDPNSGGKWNIRNLKLYLMHKFGVERTNQVYYEILMIIIRSLLAVQKIMINDKHCFELYGYDILIDDQLKAWLIEVIQ